MRQRSRGLAQSPDLLDRWVAAEVARLSGDLAGARELSDALLDQEPLFLPALITRMASWIDEQWPGPAAEDLLFLDAAFPEARWLRDWLRPLRERLGVSD